MMYKVWILVFFLSLWVLEGFSPIKDTKIHVYRYVLLHRAWFFFSHLSLKTAIDFDHFGLKLGCGLISRASVELFYSLLDNV